MVVQHDFAEELGRRPQERQERNEYVSCFLLYVLMVVCRGRDEIWIGSGAAVDSCFVAI